MDGVKFFQMINALSVWEIIFYCLVLFGFGYFSAYSKEKAKLKAAYEEASRLEQQKQDVIADYAGRLERQRHDYSLKLEELKREHEVDLVKRKYKYEEKKREYFEFMAKIDSYHGVVISVIEKDLLAILNAYHATRSRQEEKSLTQDFNSLALDAISKVRVQEAELFSGVNGLKLSASDEVLGALDVLTGSISESRAYLEECLKKISKPDYVVTRNFPREMAAGDVSMQSKVLAARKTLFAALKIDLDRL